MRPDRERGPARHRPPTTNPHPALPHPGEFGRNGNDCDCWQCTVGAAVDLAIRTGQRIAVDATDQLVIPDVIVLELFANGISVIDEPGYPVTDRAGHRTAWILSPGAVL
jgi:hypothetical protein